MRKMGWKLEGRQDLGKQRMKGRQSGQEGPRTHTHIHTHTHTHTHTDLKVQVSKMQAADPGRTPQHFLSMAAPGFPPEA